MKNSQILLGVFIISTLVGCAVPIRPIPTELQYTEAAATAESSTIVGSQENSSWADDFTAYVLAIDGKRVMSERKGWNKPIRISEGPHRLTVTFVRGVFNASANLQLDAKAGVAYQLKFVTDVGINGTNTYCDFWIVDTSNEKPVTEIVRGPVSGGGNGAFVPIFIPSGR